MTIGTSSKLAYVLDQKEYYKWKLKKASSTREINIPCKKSQTFLVFETALHYVGVRLNFVYHITKRESLILSKSILHLKLKNSETLFKTEFLRGEAPKARIPQTKKKKKKGKIEIYYQNYEC